MNCACQREREMLMSPRIRLFDVIFLYSITRSPFLFSFSFFISFFFLSSLFFLANFSPHSALVFSSVVRFVSFVRSLLSCCILFWGERRSSALNVRKRKRKRKSEREWLREVKCSCFTGNKKRIMKLVSLSRRAFFHSLSHLPVFFSFHSSFSSISLAHSRLFVLPVLPFICALFSLPLSLSFS